MTYIGIPINYIKYIKEINIFDYQYVPTPQQILQNEKEKIEM